MENPRKKRRIQVKYWCGTDNTPRHWLIIPEGVKYMVWQHEKVEHDHYQIFVECERQRRMSWMKNNVSDTAHWEAKKGTPSQAREYCMVKVWKGKDKGWKAGPWELGDWEPKQRSGSGKRNDIIDFREAIKKGTSERDLMEEMPKQMSKYYQFYERCNRLYRPKEGKRVKVTVAIGAAGTGKTKWGRKEFNYVFVVPISRTGIWFSGLDHDKHVLIDDFDGRMSKLGLKELLRLLHGWVECVETKNGHAWWHPETIFITTNIKIQRWYDWGDRTIAPLKRRIHRILDFGDVPEVECENPKDVTNTYDWDEDLEFENFVGDNVYGNRKKNMYPF